MWRMGGPVVLVLIIQLLTIPRCDVSTISLGHLVMAEGTKWPRSESMLILIIYLIARELDG